MNIKQKFSLLVGVALISLLILFPFGEYVDGFRTYDDPLGLERNWVTDWTQTLAAMGLVVLATMGSLFALRKP